MEILAALMETDAFASFRIVVLIPDRPKMFTGVLIPRKEC